MRAYVFTDKALARHAGRFVWLSIDTENATNAAVRKKLGVPALPTFFVVDPADEHVAIRWVGSGTVDQMARLFDAGVVAVKGGPAGDPATQALVRAERLFGEEKYTESIPAYREALTLAPKGWPGMARATESLLFSYSQAKQPEEVVKLARQSWPRYKGTPSAATVAASGLDGAVELPAERAGRAAEVAFFEKACRAVLARPGRKLAGDDKSGIYFSLENARNDAKDEAGLRSTREEHLAMLEGEAKAAKTAEQRTVFDAHRLSLYIELGHPERAIPMIEQSARDFPDDYNPPARLAIANKAMKKWPEALAASDRARERVYGPRQLTVLQARADIYSGMGDKAAAAKTLEDAVTIAEKMPEGQRSQRTIDALKKKLAGLQKPAN